jgi:hypothetical protein
VVLRHKIALNPFSVIKAFATHHVSQIIHCLLPLTALFAARQSEHRFGKSRSRSLIKSSFALSDGKWVSALLADMLLIF